MENNVIFRKEAFGELGYDRKDGSLLIPKKMTIEKVLTQKLSSPIFVVWEITGKCNLNCMHCSSKSESEDMNLKECYKLIDILKKEKIFHATISGGEPFLRKDLFNILSKLNKNNISFDICSNGAFLNEDIVKKLKKACPKRVYISFDGLKDTHDSIRAEGSYEKALKSLRLLKHENFDVGVIITLMKANFSELEEIIKFLVKEKIKFAKVNDLMPANLPVKEYIEKRLTNEQLEKAVSILEKYKNVMDIDSEVLIDFSFKKTYKYNFCGLGRFVARIKNNGELTPCSFFSEDYGNILKIDFQKDFWNNHGLEKMAKFPVKCLNCKKNYFCNGGCRVISNHLLGDACLPDPRCPHLK